MDDPLSALDAHVKKKIFDQVLCTELRGKTRILVTHALDTLPRVDWVIVMKKGIVAFDGTFEELKQSEHSKISDDLDLFHMKSNDSSESLSTSPSDEMKEEMKEEESPIRPTIRKSYLANKGTEIIKKENLEDVNVNYLTYFWYFFYTPAIGLLFLFGMLVNVIGFGSISFYEYNLLYWVKDLSTGNDGSSKYFMWFMIFIGISGVFLLLSNYFIFLYGRLIGHYLFKDINFKLFHAPINKYFDVTPSGVIQNWLSKEMNTVDFNFPAS